MALGANHSWCRNVVEERNIVYPKPANVCVTATQVCQVYVSERKAIYIDADYGICAPEWNVHKIGAAWMNWWESSFCTCLDSTNLFLVVWDDADITWYQFQWYKPNLAFNESFCGHTFSLWLMRLTPVFGNLWCKAREGISHDERIH